METLRRYGPSAAGGLVLLLLALAILPFALYALGYGLTGREPGATGASRFFRAGELAGNGGIALHMVAGGLVTLLAPLQLVPGLRRRWPAVHRWTGRVIVAGAVGAGLGGLFYIALRGTIGGTPMSAGFAVFGALMLLSAGQAVRFARAGEFARHRRWALRLFVLILGSWLYRVHYGLWEIATGGAYRAPDFSGAFDLVQNWAFFLPYLVALEIMFRLERAPA